MSWRRECCRPTGPDEVVGLVREGIGIGKSFLLLIGSLKEGGCSSIEVGY